MGISSLLFGIRWGDGIGIFVLVSSMILTVVGLGLCIAGFVKTVEQQNALGTIVVVSTCMLGGVYWPLDIVPDAMRKLGQLVPQYWAINGFTELVVRGGTLMEIRMPVMVLLGFAVLFLYVGIKRVRFE
jgi:ABC-2 type transport system permease protein